MELVITLVGFVAMGALCTVLERVWPEDAAQARWRSDSWIDAFYTGLRISLTIAMTLITVLVGGSLPAPAEGALTRQPVWLQAIEILLLSDLISYWIHRLLHVYRPMWRVHAIHHSAEQIDWLVASRNHPLEPVLFKVLMNYPLYLMGFSPVLLASLMPGVATYSLLLHANLSWGYGPLGYVLASPAFHRWHHSSETDAVDKNYAQLFSFWDYLFATAYFPRGVHSSTYGLRKESLPTSIWSHFSYPFRDVLPQLRRPANVTAAGSEIVSLDVAESRSSRSK
jgi:sterol desaturase/sphingolipid hydroxylase (fatty acid hydroxylase superfamily)